MRNRFRSFRKRGQVFEMIPGWVITMIVIGLVVGVLFFTLSEKGQEALRFFKDLLRFG
jgi:hypothetical protein